MKKNNLFTGAQFCPGCAIGLILNSVLSSTKKPIVTANATGCSEICISPYPRSSSRQPWIHSLFQNAAAVISGVETAYKVFSRKKLLNKEQEDIKFLAVGGDGATYDIGLQWLSGAVERGHDFVYLCLDNEGYMNTGYQRSSSVPAGFNTSTSPTGTALSGKNGQRKNLARIFAAHNMPFLAQVNPAFRNFLVASASTAFETKGPALLNAFSFCPTNWKYPVSEGLNLAKLATESGLWPIYEVKDGKYKLHYKQNPNEEALIKFLTMQKRTKHLVAKENAEQLKFLQQNIENEWNWLQKMSQE